MKQCVCLVVLLAPLAACGGEDVSTPGGEPASTDSGFSVTFDGVTVNPGEEDTRCVVKRLGNAGAMHVDRIENRLGAGSHHLIVYKASDTVERTTPFDCRPFNIRPETGVPLMITQKAEDALELPAGVGFAFAPGQMVRLEMHYINTTSSPIEVKATSTFHEMSEADFEQEADFAFFANAAIDLPPQTEVALDPLYMPLPAQLEGVSFFAFVGHVHQLGKRVRVASATGRDGADTVVYDPEGFQWAEPRTEYKDPPVVVPPGGGFRFHCEWDNTTPKRVTFGESAEDEMCLFYSYYYPSRGVVSCAHTDKIDGGYDFCCPGDRICGMLP